MKPYRHNRPTDYVQHQRSRVVRRKSRIARRIGWTVAHTGSLTKGKIHCSCPHCAVKTKSHGLPKSQQARLASYEEQLSDRGLEG
ncbi:hypothetical protein B5M42_010960 [Paenibacillus athensensis]|uniref:Uncharacterized protein n=1 Tax=Paenibacillus athensensis TaxID=1967502 RepID=A0A4Y8PYY3_9BACL|nr:hypothetical protein [Paenibacillus athensensis]MCD1259356.1 hypothetical protein [Paenibacillus athensensis]